MLVLLIFFTSLTAMFLWNLFFLWACFECVFMLMMYKMLKESSSSSVFVFFINEFIFSIMLIVGVCFGMKSLVFLFCLGKMGVFPFWYWVIKVFDDLSFNILIVMLSVYKILTLLVLLFEMHLLSVINFFIMLNLLSGVFLFFYFDNFKKFMCFLAITSTGYLLMSFYEGEVMMIYFLIYCLAMVILLVKDLNSILYISIFFFFLFYIGFPPFPTFLFKILILLKVGFYSLLTSIIFWLGSIFYICCLWGIFSWFFFKVGWAKLPVLFMLGMFLL